MIPGQARIVTGQNTILATSARIGTQIVAGQPAVLTATARVGGTTVLSATKPTVTVSQAAIMTAASRVPVSASPNHQPATTRAVTTTTGSSNLTRSFTVSAPTLTTRTTTNTSQQIIAATTTARLASTISQTTGIVVQPQIMVNTTKSVVHGANHMTTARPVQITNSGQKVKKLDQPF